MRIYDISVPITPDLPVWPGDPRVVMEQVKKVEDGDGANVTHIAMSAHTGTHVDAPYHFLTGSQTLDQIPIKAYIGRAYVLHLPEVELITAEILRSAEIPPRTRRVLFKTRNSEHWVSGESEFQTDYVGLSEDAAEYLVGRGVKLVGVDYLSVAPYTAQTPTHLALLQAGVIILEGLNLAEVSQGRYTLYCLPIKLMGVDGAPARAILIGV
jgi:arylformamidase